MNTNYANDKLTSYTSSGKFDYYFVRKIKKFLWFTWTEPVYGSSQPAHIGIYIWGRDMKNYKFIKNGVEIKLSEKELVSFADIDKFSEYLEGI
jgi:hypothetical protein